MPRGDTPHTKPTPHELMARKRMLSPEMFTSSTVAAWAPQTRWTWAGMLCYLDDYGYGEDSAALVKAAVWPRDENYPVRKVTSDVDRIVASGTLCRFECCDKPQIHAPRWSDWQKVSHPTDTRCCPCPTHSGAAHELHASLSGAVPPSSVQVNVIEGSSSADHAIGDCPATQFCKWHRQQATA